MDRCEACGNALVHQLFWRVSVAVSDSLGADALLLCQACAVRLPITALAEIAGDRAPETLPGDAP